jgi:lipopolysaccharide/colanic/teichoic acid biosynthesis glycosyltransferase
VLQGEMNLLGPRPRCPLFLERWSHTHPRQHRRLLVKPGLIALPRSGGRALPR